MKEADLIERFKDLNSQILDKNSRMKYAKDKTSYQNDLHLIEKDLGYTISLLKAHPDKNSTIKKVENVRFILSQLLGKFSKTDNSYKFSRDQGLIIQSFILIKIVEDISYAFDRDRVSASEYYLEIGSEFDCGEINRILREAIEFLNNQKINDYIELYDYVRSIQKQIVSIDKDCGRMTI
jgi:hypothetical protein